MKRKILSALLTITLIGGATTSNAYILKGDWGALPSCWNLGLCKIAPHIDWGTTINMEFDGTSANFDVATADLSPTAIATQFSGSSFVMDAKLPLSSEVSSLFNLSEGAYLPAGSYSMTLSNGIYHFSIPVSYE